MPLPDLQTGCCSRTGVRYLAAHPDASRAPVGLLCLINGIGLDQEGFRDALEAFSLPLHRQHHPYADWMHVALTVPGFEDVATRGDAPPLDLAAQAERVAAFVAAQEQHLGLSRIVIYGFSFGSDLLVEALASLPPGLERLVLAELNVRPESCFITRRITAAFEAARGTQQARHQQAHAGFVSSIMRAYAQGQLGQTLMEDMTRYFSTTARKDWRQLAAVAAEVSADPAARVRVLFDRVQDRPNLEVDLVFSDPADLAALHALRDAACVSPERFGVWDASSHGHFWHMGRQGVLENLRRRQPARTEATV